ncbi:MAG: glycerol kinase GlpK [Tissierellia bacterium]|nr:glycerol kinase GlpK [Tissierellia bacterium]
MNYYLALDAGTTSNRAILFDEGGQVVAVAQRELEQFFPHPGWVEQDPQELFATMVGVASEVLAHSGVQREQVRAIGMANQRETTIVWEKDTGRAVHNAIVWQCRRTADLAEALKERHGEAIRQKTGLEVDAYFSATKLQYILDHTPRGRERARKGELLFGTVDSYLLYRLTGVHATDVSNASRTMLYNINDMDWDGEILSWLDIPREMLPEVLPSDALFGRTKEELFGRAIPITGILGDQQAALFGQHCFEEGSVKCTYGTGAFVLMNIGQRPILSKHGLLTSVAWQMGQEVTYALEGSIFTCGSALNWLKEDLGIIRDFSVTAREAEAVSEGNPVVFVPAFTGLGTPYWDADARGTIFGISRGVTGAHLIEATLSGIAHLTADVVAAMEADASLQGEVMKVDGGVSKNDYLLNLQSELLNRQVVRSANTETTAYGAALMAKIGAGGALPGEVPFSSELFQKKAQESTQIQRDRWHHFVEKTMDAYPFPGATPRQD